MGTVATVRDSGLCRTSEEEAVKSDNGEVSGEKRSGPVRTLKVGDRITVYGDLEVVAVEARHVTVRVIRPSAPPPEPVMFPVS